MKNKLTREEYKEKVKEYKDLCLEYGVNYSLILTRYWYGTTGEKYSMLRTRLRRFMHGEAYKYSYDKEHSFMPKVEELVRLYITKQR